MTALGDRDRLVQLICQLDQEGPTADVALRRIREHLKRHGQKFVDLANALSVDQATSGKAAATPGRTQAATTPNGPFIHEPLVKGGFWSRPKEVNGKQVIRSHKPPPGTCIRLRVLAQDETYGLCKFKCSGEAEHEIYEPFDLVVVAGSEDHATIVRCSRRGIILEM